MEATIGTRRPTRLLLARRSMTVTDRWKPPQGLRLGVQPTASSCQVGIVVEVAEQLIGMALSARARRAHPGTYLEAIAKPYESKRMSPRILKRGGDGILLRAVLGPAQHSIDAVVDGYQAASGVAAAIGVLPFAPPAVARLISVLLDGALLAIPEFSNSRVRTLEASARRYLDICSEWGYSQTRARLDRTFEFQGFALGRLLEASADELVAVDGGWFV